MADIWISLQGNNDTATGSIDRPYRDFATAYAIKGDIDNVRFRFSTAGGNPDCIYEELPIHLSGGKNISILADIPNIVYIKTQSLFIDNVTLNLRNISFLPTDETSNVESFITIQNSHVDIVNSNIYDVPTLNIKLLNSDVTITSMLTRCVNINSPVISIEGNSRTSIVDLKTTGVYNSALVTDENTLRLNLKNMIISDEFSRAMYIHMADSEIAELTIEDIKITPDLNKDKPKGITLINVKSITKPSYIYKILCDFCVFGVYFRTCEMMIDKGTFCYCDTAIVGEYSSTIKISNCILAYNKLALQSEHASILDFSYINFFHNDTDVPVDYVDIEDPFILTLHADFEYQLPDPVILQDSEVVVAEKDPSLRFKRNIDYELYYGNDVTHSYIKRIPEANGGDIPSGLSVKITYKIPALNPPSGTFVRNGRIRRVDPFFVSLADHNYELADASPLINTGFPSGLGSFLGNAPDLGYWERTSAASSDESILELNLKASDYTVTIPTDLKNTLLLQEENLAYNYPHIDITEGSAVRDLLLKPASHMLDPMINMLSVAMTQQSVFNAKNLTEYDMDLIAANWFVYRRQGERARGVVRFYLYEPLDIHIPIGTEFLSGDKKYYTTSDNYFLSDEVAFNVDNEYYFVDVAVISEKIGSDYNVPEGSINTVTNLKNSNIVHVSNPYPMTSAMDKETNEELYSRMKRSLSTRVLINNRSISSVLYENFSNVRHMVIVGAGEPEMNRDIIKEFIPYTGPVHVYGCVDVYVAFSTLNSFTYDCEIDNDGKVYLNEFTVPILPMVYIEKVVLTDEGGNEIKTIDPSEYTLYVKDPNYRYSIKEDMTLKFEDSIEYALQHIRIYYKSHPSIREIQEYMWDGANRVVCADFLVKHFIPKIINLHIDYTTTSEDDFVSDIIVNSVKSYIMDTSPGYIFRVSDLYLSVVFNGGDAYSTPVISTVEHLSPDGNRILYNSEDEIVASRIEKFIPGIITASRIAN